jgi:hypothetical protein
VIEIRDMVFDEFLSHNPLESFPLLSTNVLKRVSMDLSPPHFINDSSLTNLSSRTLSIVKIRMEINGETLINSMYLLL